MGPSSLSARRVAAAIAVVVFVLVSAAGLLHRRPEPRLAMPADRAARIALATPELRRVVRPTDRVEGIYVDHHIVKVMWYRGGRAIATAGVQDGQKIYGGVYHGVLGWGALISHALLVLAGLTALFLLATLRRPLLSARTLDVVALAAFVVPTVLLDRAWFGWGEGLVALLLLYLGARGAWLAVRGPAAAGDRAEHPVLLAAAAARARLPRLGPQVTLALLAATVLVTLTSMGVVDIAIADMEGATLLTHGVLPYGHMPGDIPHSDTYGLPVFLFYAPFAALWPMPDSWSDATGALVANALVVFVCLAGVRSLERGVRWPALLALLAFPPALMGTSSGTNDVLIAAALIWAFAWYTRPAASSALIMLAGAAKIGPLALLPLWLARLRGAELVRALVACAVVAAATLAGLVAFGGVHGPEAMAHAIGFQFSRRSELSVWTALHLQALQPLAKGLALAAPLAAAALVWGDRDVAADPRRVAGLVTAVLAALQLAANHWAPMYLLWFAPPTMVALLGPLGATAAAPVGAEAQDDDRVPAGARFAPV